MRSTVLRVYFNQHGKAKRVVRYVSSGDRARDQMCETYCMQMSIPIPRLGTKKMGELWRQVVIQPDAVLDVTPKESSGEND